MRYTVILPWLAGLLLQGILLGILLAKRMWRKFPVFVVYSASNFVLGAGLYGIYVAHPSRALWFRAYWINEGIGLLLGLGLVYEIFKHLISPYPGLRKLASLLFRSAIIALLLVGCVLALSQPSGQDPQITRHFLIADEAARILEIGMLFCVFLFASLFGLHWRQYVFGVALGMGFFTAVELVRVTMRVHFGFTSMPILDLVRIVSFNLGLLIWISYLLAPELASSPSELPKRSQLEQWNRAIMELIYQ
ncbi:MAG TPA: hypothetical protein VI685_03380 [Candidatus Angelobacter sp.]